MPEPIIFNVGGKKYRVKNELLADFIKSHPDATTLAYESGKPVRVRADEYGAFLGRSAGSGSSAIKAGLRFAGVRDGDAGDSGTLRSAGDSGDNGKAEPKKGAEAAAPAAPAPASPADNGPAMTPLQRRAAKDRLAMAGMEREAVSEAVHGRLDNIWQKMGGPQKPMERPFFDGGGPQKKEDAGSFAERTKEKERGEVFVNPLNGFRGLYGEMKPRLDWKTWTTPGTYEGERHAAEARAAALDKMVAEATEAADFDAKIDELWKRADERTMDAVTEREKRPIRFGQAAFSSVMADALSNRASYYKTHDLGRMENDAWNMLGKEGQDALVSRMKEAGRMANPEVDDSALTQWAEQQARNAVARKVFEKAVRENEVKNGWDYFGRVMMDNNLAVSLTDATVRGMSDGSATQHYEAKQMAMDEYRLGHSVWAQNIFGTVAGMALDPSTYIGGAAGKAAVSGGLRLSSRLMGKAATRKAAATLGGRVATGVGAGGVNFATFEGLHDVGGQMKWGGQLGFDEATGRYTVGDYSLGSVLGSMGHGLLMGGATGVVAPLVGNVADKAVRSTNSNWAKMGLRTGEVATSAVLEATIFSMPEWIAGEGDAMDVFMGSLGQMGGFKVPHVAKAGARFFAGIRQSGNQLTMEGRVWNRQGLRERVSSLLDGNPGLALTKDEKAELRQFGYDDVRELADPGVKDDPEIANAQVPYERLGRLMNDGRISEAARAKMYYYVTGRMMRPSTVMASSIDEVKDADGHTTGWTVRSHRSDGNVVTCRTFGSREAAEKEVAKIDRQVELNTIDVGEQYRDARAAEWRMWEACRKVANEEGLPVDELRTMMKRKAENRNVVEQEWAARVEAEIEGLRNRFGSEAIRSSVSEETGVDIDAALRKTEERRTDEERTAVKAYAERLFPEKPSDLSQRRLEYGDAPEFAQRGDYFRGYDAEGYTQDDIAVEARNGDKAAVDAWNGVQQRVRDDEQYAAAERKAFVRKVVHQESGGVVMATLKERMEKKPDDTVVINDDAETPRKRVYVVSGRVVMANDGSVDKEMSDPTIVVYDVETGVRRMISPSSETGILSVDLEMSLDAFDAMADRSAEENAQRRIDAISGRVRAKDGDSVELEDGRTGIVVSSSKDGAEVVVQTDAGDMVTTTVEALQRRADAKLMAAYRYRHGMDKAEEQPGEEGAVDATPTVDKPADAEKPADADKPVTGTADAAPTVVKPDKAVTDAAHTEVNPDDAAVGDGYEFVGGAPEVYEPGMEVRIRDEEDGKEKAAVVQGRMRYENGAVVPDQEGGIVRYMVGTEMRNARIDHMKAMTTGYVRKKAVEPVDDVNGASDAAPTVVQPAAPSETTTPAVPAAPAAEDVMPMIGSGDDAEPDFMKTTPERGHRYIYDEAGLSREEANAFVKANIDEAKKSLEKVKNKEPKMGTNLAAYRKSKAEHEQRVANAEAAVAYWQGVKAAQDSRLAEERRRQDERLETERKKDEAALAAEREALKKAEAERRAVGVAKPMPAITEKWNKAEKVDGRMDEIVLADGTTLTGHYVLHESGASSASHDVTKGFAKTEGFPLDVNDNSVNDRDYEKDRDAQEHTRGMARRYDQRALQSVPVVSSDGVVLSGNGRTMAGELAAAEGTDGAYVDYLKRHADRFGFTEEQVGSMAHPRVSFVPDEAMPYTAETFARFNKQDMKSQSKTEAAVKLGKTVSDDVFGDITRVIHGFETLSEFYNNPESSLRVLRMLLDGGVLSDAQMAEMVDGVRGDERLSAVGRDFLENVLVGKAFASDPDVVRMLTAEPSMRSTVVSALVEITDNLALGDAYTLERQLSDAVRLCYDARKAGYKVGEPVSIFARQGELFAEPDELQTAADFNNATMLMLADVINSREVTKLRKTLALYNDAAREPASGQMDMFAEGGIRSREDVLRDVINYINKNGRTKAIKDAVAAGVARRREASVPKDGVAEAGIGGSENAERRGGGKTPVERKSDLAKAAVTAPLSEEVNEFDKPFVISSNGTTIFGEVGADSGLTAAPIKLSVGENVKDDHGTNHGYGLLHIEAGHGDQIRAAGFSSVEEFVETVARNYDTIREGGIIADNQTYLLEVSDEHNNTLFIQLSRDGSYWNVNSAGIFKKKYSRRKPEVFTRPALEPDTNTDTSGVDSGQANGVTTPAGNSPQTSESKGKGISSTSQAKGEKVAENQSSSGVHAALAAAEQETNTEPTEAQKGDAVKDANEPTVLRLNGEEHSVSDIEKFVKEQVLRVIEEGEFDAEIVGVKVIGSYMRGEQTSESDLDVLVEYRGKAKEDALFDAIAEEGLEINGVNVDINPITKGKSGTIEEFIKRNTGFSKVAKAEGEVNTEPTEAQKKAGNYRKGHVRIDGFDVSIEQPKGSVRRGTDADGKQWQQKMNNTYGYIRGTEGVDGDHIDVFLSDDPSQGDVFVVDQVNKDGSFDEHKVMYGFPDIESARKAYLSNYEDGWTGLGAITPVSKEEFKKWVESSHRKTKPFADYKNVKKLTEDVDQRPTNVNAEGLVVDEKGKPLTLYHGTPNDVEFSSLESGHVRDGEEVPARFNGNGISFTPDRTVATEYATSEGGKGKVFDVNVTLKKPYFTVGVVNFSPEEASAFTEKLIAQGYDGIINYASEAFRELGALPNEVIVFDIKSANQVETPKKKENKKGNGTENAKQPTAGYSIEPTTYTNKKGKTTPMHLVTFDRELSKDEIRAGKELAKESRGWWDREKGGFMMRNEESAKALAEALSNEEAVQDAQPLSLADMEAVMSKVTDLENVEVQKPVKEYHGGDRVFSVKHNANKDIFVAHHKDGTVEYTFTDGTKANADEVQDALPEPKKVNVESLMGELNKKGEAKLSDHTEEQQQEESAEQPKQKEKKAKSKWVNDEDADRFEELRARLKQKLRGQMNMGVDPEIFAIGVEMSYLMLKKGARRFNEFAKNLIEALGDEVRPYIKAFYNGARDLPEMADLEKDMTTWDEVRSFDVMNFDKEGAKDIVATAKHIVREQTAEREAKEATDKLKQERNEQRKETEQEVAANTEALASEAATVASEVESKLPSARNEREVNDLAKNIDDAIDKVNDQLALLGYYEAEPVESDFNEAYGYMRNAEKKAVKNVTELFKTLTKELGISDPVVYDARGKKQKNVTANIAPAGGEVTMRIMLNRDKGVELYISFSLAPDYENNRDNLVLRGIMFRPERNLPNGGREYLGSNDYLPDDVTIPQMLQGIRSVCREWLPKEDYVAMAQRIVAKNAGNQQEKSSKERKSKKKSVSLQKQTIPDLFSGLFSEELKQTSNEQEVHVQPRTSTTERERGHQREQNEPLGESKQNEDERPDAGRVVRRSGNDTKSDTAGGSRVSEPSDGKRNVKPAKPEPAPLAESERKNTHNNTAERGTDYAPKGTSARIEANIKAIETMQRLIESGEPATPEDMSVLRKFSGWGGLGAAFKEKVSRGDSGYNPRLHDDYQPANPINARLRELLSPEAYEAANMSRNSAYYTPAPVIDAMWDVARAMGFRGGNVLEGSAGIGNIIGLMPTDMSERSNIHAVEIDETTGNILSLLYPDANVEVKGFEKTFVPNGSVDLAITNVPFVTGLRVIDETGDKDLSRKFHDIHDFCIAKNVRKLKEGGVGIFITSSGTLDSPNSAKLRTWLVNEGGADVVGAFRMHNQTFGGTGATSDIIVIRKRVNGRKSANAIDVSGTQPIRTVKYNTGETKRGSSEVIVKDLALDVNKHFVEHPEDMAGEMAFAFEKGDTYRATSKALYPIPSINQEQRLSEWAQHFKDLDWDKAEERESQQVVYEDLGEDVKEGSMLLDSDGNLCLAQRGKAAPINVNANKVKGHTKAECFNAYKAIKDALADVLEYQTTHSDDSGLRQRLAKLNKAYDSFVKTYGHLNKNTSISFLRSDMDYPSIAALESVSETGDKSGKRIVTYGKTDIFSRRVVETESEPKPTTIKDGIIASIYLNGRVDVQYIADQLNMSEGDVRQQIIESGLGFENPTTTDMEVSYEYLSGNVREKLRQAQENNTDGRYDANIKALERVIPMNIPAHLIEFTLGSSWVEPKLYQDFVKERTGLDVKLTNAGGTWIMSEPYYTDTEQNKAMGVISEKFDKTILGHELIKAAITCKSISVTKTISTGYGSSKTTETIVDKEATMACANKIDEIRQDFKDWARGKMQGDPEMSERMERVYNELFNNSVPKEIPDEFVPEHFGGAATVVNGKPFKLRPHQAKAVIRATTQSLMLAHEVGTGKTYTLISTAMEMRRLGTARKPMIVVQNATVGQFVASAKALYPNAKILTLEDADRNADGRRNFYAKIRYNDWDMIVVPQSVFERIPDSEERQIRFVEDKIEEKMAVLEKMREAADNDRDPVLRQAQRELEQLEEERNNLQISLSERKGKTEKDEKREAKTRQNAMVKAQEMLDRETDDVANFDDMGIDALLIDEAHEYKHLGFATAMQRGVKGVDPSYSKKSQGVYLKTQAVLENKNGKNVVFATGTPISNTAAEIWTFMRYLMPADTMREYGIYYFDDFVRNFGNIQQMMEFSINGKYKENNRFAGYVNLPELVRIWASVADTVLTREAGGVSDKIPKMEGEKAQDIYLPQTKALRGVMKFVKEQIDDYEKMSGKEKKENSHIPLVMYGIAKAAAVDARLVLEDAADEPNSKTNEAVRQTLRSLEDTKEYNGTVAIFADNYQNKATGFNLYEDIRKKLIDAGVPEAQVVVMKSGMSIKKKLEIFDKVNRGEVRVIMGSTFTLGTGVNIQERLHTLIHVDAPNRPMDYTQRNGRILRQGNLHNEWGIPVRVLRFGVEDSLDVTAYQRLKTKGAIADSIMEGKKMMSNSMENRVLEEEQDLFGDITAQLSGSQYALLKNQVEKEVKKLEARKKQWEADQTYVHNQKPRLKALIKDSEERAKRNKEALAKVEAAKNDGITIGKMKFPSLDAMGDYIKDYNSKQREQQEQVRTASGYQSEAKSDLTVSVGGFDFHIHRVISKEQKHEKGQLLLSFFSKTQMTYSCPELGLEDVPVDGQRLKSALDDILENVLSGDDFREKAEYADRAAERYKGELQQVEARDGKPFEYADELKQAKEKLAEYEELMKAEMAEKEAKYAEMDASVEAAKGVQLSDEDSDDVTEDTAKYRIREDEPPTKTGIGYKVFVLKDGKLYPPMIANPGGEATPVGVWLDADAAPVVGVTKTGRQQVKAGGKGTQGGSGKLSYRPGWHLGEIPYALQFNRMNPETGQRELFPANFVWAEVEYANDVDYQEEAMSYGMTASGKFKHSLAGLPRLPENGSYRYRTNPNPETDPWIITGAMKVNRILKPSEVDAMVEAAGREPQQRQAGAITDEQVEALNAKVKRTMQEDRDMMRSAAEQMGEKLHTDINIIEDVNEITHPNAAVQELRRKSKGWYDTKTGQVNIVLANNRDVDDVKASVGHETIAHKGLRELVGEENYDQFLNETYSHLRDDLKKGVDAAAGRAFIDDTTKNGKRAKSYEHHRRTAVDELFGRLAEKPFDEFSEGERTLWQKLKATVRRLLDKFLGSLKLPKWFELGDNELRYILWRSKKRLERGGDVVEKARDIVKREELGLTDEARYNMGDAPETFTARQKRAVENKGTVMPGLNGAQMKVVGNIPRHTYTGNIAEATQQAIDAAKAKYVPNGEPRTLHYNNFGAEFDYSISGNAIEIVLSAKHQGKSVNKGVHLALAEHLDRVIGESIEVEEHPDRIKTGDARDNGKINPDALMHRFYGVANIDGVDYRVMTLMKEENKYNRGNGIHSYDVQKIEVLDEESPNTSNGVGTLNSELEGYPSAKLLNDVVKTMDNGKKILAESEKSDADTALYRDGDDVKALWDESASMGLEERIALSKAVLAEHNRADHERRDEALAAITEGMSAVRRAMAAQRQYDRTTVKRVTDLARIMLQYGYLDGMRTSEVKRLVSAIKGAAGKEDTSAQVQKVMDLMVENQLRRMEDSLHTLETVKATRVDDKGVVVQGRLDVEGQAVLSAFSRGRRLEQKDLDDLMGETLNRMDSDDDAVSADAAMTYEGMLLAQRYVGEVRQSELEEERLRADLKAMREEADSERRRSAAYKEAVSGIEDAIRKTRIGRAQALHYLVRTLSGRIGKSMEAARHRAETDKARVREIQHNANSDLEGVPCDIHRERGRQTLAQTTANNPVVRFLFSPLLTMEQMMRFFGRKSANGEGYLFNRFVRGWIDCRNHEIEGTEEKMRLIDDKAKALFGREAPTLNALVRLASGLPKMDVTFIDIETEKRVALGQGNLMYIYMVNKMTDGRMKLRRMGISELDVEAIAAHLDPRLREMADWIQEDFMVACRNGYNETHKRLYGAPMAAIEDYFPLRVLQEARQKKEEELDDVNKGGLVSTATGAVKKRVMNTLPLDILNTDALLVLMEHVKEMEHWNAFAEYKRDINTLRTYRHFESQVKNLTSVYGSGDVLWKNFNDVCRLACGSYSPKDSVVDKTAVNLAKGYTQAMISLRIHTALKQLLSFPAHLPDVKTKYILADIANPEEAWRWSMANLPIIRARWKERIAGDTRLMKSDLDWKMWRTKYMELSSRVGMTPNAFFDAVMVCIGAHAIYLTSRDRYLRYGYSEEQAEQRAKQDAAMMPNLTQQSSENLFVSPLQKDRTFFSVTVSTFRNASMAYQRQLHDALRNLSRQRQPGWRPMAIDFEAKKMMRETGMDKTAALRAAKMKLNHEVRRSLTRVATFGFVCQMLWNMGSGMWYLLFGDDDKVKKDLMEEASVKALFGSVEGLSYGDQMSENLSALAMGQGHVFGRDKALPIESEMGRVWRDVSGGRWGELTADLVNLVAMGVTGFNPETLTEVVTGIMDACGGDMTLSNGAAILTGRLVSAPKSTLDKLYFDEVSLIGREAGSMTPSELSSLYARHEVRRGYVYTPWMWDDEDALSGAEKKAEKKMKERLASLGDAEVNAAYADCEAAYNEVRKTLSEAREADGYVGYARAMETLRKDEERFMKYALYKECDGALDQIAKAYLASQSIEEAELCKRTMEAMKAAMVRAANAKSDEARERSILELKRASETFKREYGRLSVK